jgi:sugar O-acyltransferase (sialic acid O-acetyltransferase NeuD family)
MKDSREPVAVIGGSGHAKVVISLLQACGRTVSGVYDDDPRRWGSTVLGVPVAGPAAAIAESSHLLGVIAVGNNLARKRLANLINLRWETLVHPSAYVHPSVSLGAGSVVFAGAIIQPETAIGDHVIVNTGATVDHDCQIGDFVHLAPGVHLAGAVRVGEGVFLGIGSSVVQCLEIGAWTTVGAGGVVVSNLPSDVVATGVPAKPRSPL